VVRIRRSSLAAALALMVTWLVAPAAVPLYDGVGFPDEPYRFVQPPPGYRKTAPPTGAFGHVPASGGTSRDDFDAASREQGPQVEVFISRTGLTGPNSVRWFDIRADPIAPGPSPTGMPINGNAYRVQVDSDPPGPVTVKAQNDNLDVWIALRATAARDSLPTMLYRASPAAAWRPLQTEQAGTDVYDSAFAGPGDYALSFLPGAARTQNGRQTSHYRSSPLLLVVIASLLLIVVVIISAVRISRSEHP
jgi:hypothetical protein